MKSYSVICVSTKNNNIVSEFLSKDNKKKKALKLDYSSVKNLDFTHALINNGMREYSLGLKDDIPEFNEVKNSWMISHVYWRHDEREYDGFQNLKSTMGLLLKSLSCAEKQNIDVRHCQSIEILLPETNDSDKEQKVRIISLLVTKLKNGHYNKDTKAIVTFFSMT